MSVSSISSSASSSLSLLQQWQQKIFSSIDSDGDGSVTKSELESAVTKAGGTSEEADALYSKLDPDNTGSVSESQFSANMPVPKLGDQMVSQLISYQSVDSGGSSNSKPTSQLASDLFSSIDTDGDGVISKSELETAVTNAGGSTDEADALYAKLDPDNTGSVSESAFAQALQPPPPPPPPSSDSSTSSDSSDSSSSTGSSSSSSSSPTDTASVDALKALIEAMNETSAADSSGTDSGSTDTGASNSSSGAASSADDAMKALLDALKQSSASTTSSNSDSGYSLAGAALQNLLHYYAAAGNLMTPDFLSSSSTSA